MQSLFIGLKDFTGPKKNHRDGQFISAMPEMTNPKLSGLFGKPTNRAVELDFIEAAGCEKYEP